MALRQMVEQFIYLVPMAISIILLLHHHLQTIIILLIQTLPMEVPFMSLEKLMLSLMSPLMIHKLHLLEWTPMVVQSIGLALQAV